MQKKQKTRLFKEKWGCVRDWKITKEREDEENWAATHDISWRRFYKQRIERRAAYDIRRFSRNDFRDIRSVKSWKYYDRDWFIRAEDVKNQRLYLKLFEEEIEYTHYEWLNGDDESPLFVDLRDWCPDYKLLRNDI
jgi:predicted helicase